MMIRFLKNLPATFLVLATLSPLMAQPDKPLPFDPLVTRGKLDNGLTYYIRENREPENRASFRLVVDAGSILEKEDTRGLAHFLEHMAFNGTENFEKQELVEFLESIGMRFGADLNAYTSFDETVYMLEIPMDDEEILAKTFQILEDWAHNISFDPEEIEKERGVVLEEWRLRLGAQNRIMDQQFPVLFHDSRYAERLPIGKPEVIASLTREDFLEFYRNFYRPNLMAVIAVGDFETEKIQELIEKHFAHLRNPEDAPPRPEFPIPGHEETLFSIATDHELSDTSISIAYKREKSDNETEADYRRYLAETLYSRMLNARLRELTQEKDPPYLGAYTRKGGFVGPIDVVMQTATVEEGQYADGLKALLIENKRARVDGFTEAELHRAKANLMRGLERAYKERDQRPSGSHAGELTSNFLENEPVPGIPYELELARKYLPTLSLEEVSDIGDDWITDINRVILYTAPEKEGLTVPAEQDILAVIQEAEASQYEAYEETDLSDPLLDQPPQPGTVARETYHESVDVTEWKLSNGIRVILKPTDFKKDQVLVSAFSPGGHSLAPDRKYVPASSADRIIGGSGIGNLDAQDLRKKLAGIQADVQPSIGELYENLSGGGSPEDLETLFQLIHMRFIEPRTDEDAFGALITQMRAYVSNRLNDPEAVFADAVEKTLYQNHPRHQPLDMDAVEEMDLEESFAFYRNRYADADDFTFIFVGAFELPEMRPLVERYLASLPSLPREETWRDVGDEKLAGQHRVVVRKGVEPKSSVQIYFHGSAEWSYEDQYLMGALIDVIRIPMREALREDKGGVYGVGVSGSLNRYPEGGFSTSIRFGCNPENVDDLIGTAFSVIEKIKQEGPDAENLAAVKEMHLRSNETTARENSFWSYALTTYAKNGIDFDAVNRRDARTHALTADMIQQAAKRYFDHTNRLIAILLPEVDSKEG